MKQKIQIAFFIVSIIPEIEWNPIKTKNPDSLPSFCPEFTGKTNQLSVLMDIGLDMI